tara:strand:+ start:1132 stop:1344 length:213 start_codon:yes stop_codon:yes gene_type:complete
MNRSDNDLIDENKQLKDMLSTIRAKVDAISQDSCHIIKTTDSDLDNYDTAYRINQEAHDIIKMLETYCSL